MLVSQRTQSSPSARQGSLRTVLAELQRRNVAPSRIEDGLRQRLLVLKRRLARVQSLGSEYARVSFSGHAQRILDDDAVPTV